MGVVWRSRRGLVQGRCLPFTLPAVIDLPLDPAPRADAAYVEGLEEEAKTKVYSTRMRLS